MGNGRGSIYLRAGKWTIDFTVDGKRIREGIGTSKRVAEMVLKKRATEAIEGKYFKKRNGGTTPFSEFGETYLERVTAFQKSARTERTRVLSWMRHFNRRPLGQITRNEIEEWQRQKRMSAKPATVNRTLCRLRHMFNKAVEWEMMEENPMKRLKFLRENNARQRYLTLAECHVLLEACSAPYIKDICSLAIHTGMRQGEILNLRFCDLDFASRTILIRDSKNGQPRHVPMDSTVLSMFTRTSQNTEDEFIFPARSGKRRTQLQKGFSAARKNSGLIGLHFHDLRHTFASHWVMNGGDLYVLRDLLGHKSITMTQRYAHLCPAYKRAVVDRLDNIWDSPKQGTQPSAETNPEVVPVTSRSQEPFTENSDTSEPSSLAG